MSTKKIELNYYTGSSYDVLYPIANISHRISSYTGTGASSASEFYTTVQPLIILIGSRDMPNLQIGSYILSNIISSAYINCATNATSQNDYNYIHTWAQGAGKDANKIFGILSYVEFSLEGTYFRIRDTYVYSVSEGSSVQFPYYNASNITYTYGVIGYYKK